MTREGDVTVGVVGLGYWGPNLARNFAALEGCRLTWCCDSSEEARSRWERSLPGTRFTGDLADLLADEELDAVVVATDVPSHAALAIRTLSAGKHCFVEKPLARSAAEAAEVVAAADAAGRTLMVGHLLEYHPGDREAEGDRRPRESSATSSTCTPTGSTSARSARTRMRSGVSVRTTSRCCCTCSTARSPRRC